MSKKTIHTNFRVTVEPRSLGDFGYASISDHMVIKDESDRLRQYRERCEEIVANIKRHVDSVGAVHVECDTESVCEYCGSKWTEDNLSYNGGCCGADMAAQDVGTVHD